MMTEVLLLGELALKVIEYVVANLHCVRSDILLHIDTNALSHQSWPVIVFISNATFAVYFRALVQGNILTFCSAFTQNYSQKT